MNLSGDVICAHLPACRGPLQHPGTWNVRPALVALITNVTSVPTMPAALCDCGPGGVAAAVSGSHWHSCSKRLAEAAQRVGMVSNMLVTILFFMMMEVGSVIT